MTADRPATFGDLAAWVGRRRIEVASTCGVVLGGLVYALLLLDFRWDPGRTAVGGGYASNFFDIQMRAFLDGSLEVPPDSLGIEGFVIRGKTYMYFPPFPALVRAPVMLTTTEFDGHLTVLSMGLAWLVFAVMTARLLWLVRTVVTRSEAVPSGRECIAATVMLAACTGGTVLSFDAALPWVYHEVYAWAVAMVVSACYWIIRLALAPTRWAAGWLCASACAAIMTRTTGGVAVALATLALAAYLGLRRTDRDRRMALVAVGAGLLPLALSAAYNWVKFRHPYMFPLEHQIWTQVNERRREALAVNGGTITGPQFLATNTIAYLRPDGIRFTGYFPYVSLPPAPPREYAGAFLDQAYRTGSIVPFMPLLVAATLVGGAGSLLRVRTREGKALVLALIAAALVVGPVLMYGYVTHRYTSEFVPLLVVGGIIGFWMLVPRLLRRPAPAGVALVLLALVAGYQLAVQLATGYAAASLAQRGDRLVSYVEKQLSLPGRRALRPMVVHADEVPRTGSVDRLLLLDYGGALYLGTGDTYEPWVLVEQRPVLLLLRSSERVRSGRVTLVRIDGQSRRTVELEVRRGGRGRVVVTGADNRAASRWFALAPQSEVRVGVGVQPDVGRATVSVSGVGTVAEVSWASWDRDWVARAGSVTVDQGAAWEAERLGIALTQPPPRPLELARAVADLGSPR